MVELRGREGKERRVQRELEVELGEEREGKRRAEAVIRQVQLEGERSLAAQQVVSIYNRRDLWYFRCF